MATDAATARGPARWSVVAGWLGALVNAGLVVAFALDGNWAWAALCVFGAACGIYAGLGGERGD